VDFLHHPNHTPVETEDPDSLYQLQILALWLDNRFRIPGTNITFGFDGLIGLLPGVGDFLTAVLSLYLFWKALRHKVSLSTIVQMMGNIIIDMLFGTIPVVGDIFDVFYRSNKKNVDLILRDIEMKKQK